jgi:hypothetical protein
MKFLLVIFTLLLVGCGRVETNDGETEVNYILSRTYEDKDNSYDLGEISEFILNHPYRAEIYQSDKFGDYTFGGAMCVFILDELRRTEQEEEFLNWMAVHSKELGIPKT